MSILDKCKCCLEDGDLKELWAEYILESEIEIYGEMLHECFAFPRENITNSEYICEKCIDRLRSSLSFRRDILAAKEVLQIYLQKEPKIETENCDGRSQDNLTEDEDQEDYMVKIEDVSDTIPEESLASIESSQDEELIKVEYLSDSLDDEDIENDEDYKPDEEQGMEVEYLEDDEDAETAIRSTKKPKTKGRTYKKYSQDDLQTAMKLVSEGKLAKQDACNIYSIPIKTLNFKLKTREKDNLEDSEPAANSKRMQFFEEIRTLMTFTNVTPYKSKTGRFYCAYCSTDGPSFEDTEALRVHTRTEHAQERLKSIDSIMRPYYLNEILKVDIHDLYCFVCTSAIDGWSNLFVHLKDMHSVAFEQVQNRVIPYDLTNDLACAFCKQRFSHFHNLDSHMNAHYSNYICGECGDTFLAENRLKKHVQTHSTQKVPCPECGKVFSLEKYKRKHFDLVHKKTRKPFGCSYCKERFFGDYTRHLHILEHHPEKIKEFKCDYCDMKFTWRPYYLKHIRIQHSDGDKFQCKLCTKKFTQKHLLKWHEEWHKGDGYTCGVCNKRFSSKNYLKKHMVAHIKYTSIEY